MPRYSTKLKPKTKEKQSFAPLWLVLASLVLVLIAAWAFFGNNTLAKSTVEVKGSPRVKVDNDVIDRGDVKLGMPIRDVVRVTNVGDKSLRFLEAPYVEVREGC
jgi:hypothetical protein